MRKGLRAVVAVLSIAMVTSVAMAAAVGEPEHFLDYSEDTYKSKFISGKFTASVTKVWPRVDFQHSDNLLAPMFEVGMERLFLFNDTNRDGVFSSSEALYTSLLDESHAEWKVSTVEFTSSDTAGECAHMSMSSLISLYKGLVETTDKEPDVAEWANLSFAFTISERTTEYTNSLGQYSVAGRTGLRILMGLEVMTHVDASGVALELDLMAGGSAYLFLLREQASKGEGTVLTSVSSRVDETDKGPDFTHRFQQTRLPTQEIEFSKDDGTVQAYYHFSSEPTTNESGMRRAVLLNSSYFTTGTGLVLHQAYSLGNATDNLAHDMSLGLDMEGFIGILDWAMENLPILAIITGGIVAITVVSVYQWRRKRRRAHENGESMLQEADSRLDTGPK